MKDEIISERIDGMEKTPEEIWAEFVSWYLSEVENCTVNYLEEKQRFDTMGKIAIATAMEDCQQ